MKMKSLLGVMVLLLAVPAAQAAFVPTFLPDSDYVDGVSVFNNGTVSGFIEYAVYDTASQVLAGYDRSERYVYAYQVFNTGSTAIDAVAILGFDPLAVSAGSLDVSDELDGTTTGGMDATALLDTEDVQALYFFDSGAVVQNTTSWFLLMFSDYDWVKGSYEINPSDSDVVVPGRDTDDSSTDGSQVPEPATLAMLLGGGLLSLRRKR